ncbi:SMR family transporter [Aliarcobacter cryaerophilus]|nr:SMR family transporter [Aliarcobacter cryaerophilus]
MSWTILFLAGIFEIFWAVGLKYSDGFTKLFPTISNYFYYCYYDY